MAFSYKFSLYPDYRFANISGLGLSASLKGTVPVIENPGSAVQFAIRSNRQISFVLFALTCLLFNAVSCQAQGFSGSVINGKNKKKVVLHRKLPAAIHVTESTFDIKATARDKSQADVAQSLSDTLQSEIQKSDSRLRAEKSSSDLMIACTITHFETPPPQTFSRNEVVLQKGHSLEEAKKFYKVTGALEVAYQVKEAHSGKVLDSDNLTAKYSREFEAGSNQEADQSLQSKAMSPFKRAVGKKSEESSGPPTPLELRQTLIRNIVSQITMTLVNTDENVEVYLARGKLEEANKLAEAGLWSRDLETLETMPPLKTPQEDAYRLYNIAVADEALAYQAEDHATAKKFIEQAAINYGKAIDAKPDEKFFLEPQNRIEAAAAHYRRLEQRHESVTRATIADSEENVAHVPETPGKPISVVANDTSTGKSTSPNSKPKSLSASAPTRKSTAAAIVNNASLKQKAASAPALTNAKVIEMFKSGVDEDNIVATIRQAPVVQFDVSPDGQIELAKNGVKGKILTAMRERAHRTKTETSSQ